MFHQKQTTGKKYKEINVTIAINFLYSKNENIYPGYVSKHNSNREKQAILELIPKDAKLSVKDGNGIFLP